MTLQSPYLDRRVRMLPCQKEMVVHLYNRGASIHSLSRMYKVSKRLIQFIIFPERKEANYQRRVERGGSMAYYDRDKHKASMKKHREHKKEIFKTNKTTSNGKDSN